MAFGVSVARLGDLGSSPSSSVPKVEHTTTIAKGVINVGAGDYDYRQFEVPADASNAIVRGGFYVNGSIADEIRVMIFNAETFAKWQSDYTLAENYYFSTDVTTANLEADVPSGQTFYIVFDNTFSATSSKSVIVDIELAFLQ